MAGMWMVLSLGNRADRLGGRVADQPATSTPQASPSAALLSDGRREESYPYSIRGEVIDASGNPLAAVHVEALSEHLAVPFETTTDEQGHFTIWNTPLDFYTVQARTVGFHQASRSGIAPDGLPVRLTLQPIGGTSGRVLFEGEGVPGVRVFLGGPGLFPPVTTVSRVGGEFVIEEVSTLPYLEVVALGSDLGSGFGQVFPMTNRGQVQIQLQPAVPLAIEVSDAITGSAVPQGLFTVSGEALRFIAVSGDFAGGTARMEGLPLGDVYLRVRAPGYLSWEGQVHHDGRVQPVRLQPGFAVMGRVVDDRGQPIAGADLAVTVRDSSGGLHRFDNESLQSVELLLGVDGRPVWPPRQDLTTGDQGRFEIRGLPSGQVSIQADAEGYRPAGADSIQVGQNQAIQPVEIQLQRVLP